MAPLWYWLFRGSVKLEKSVRKKSPHNAHRRIFWVWVAFKFCRDVESVNVESWIVRETERTLPMICCGELGYGKRFFGVQCCNGVEGFENGS